MGLPTLLTIATMSASIACRLGIAAYGFSPFALDALELRTVHAPDERISLTTLDQGVETMTRVVRALVLSAAGAQ